MTKIVVKGTKIVSTLFKYFDGINAHNEALKLARALINDNERISLGIGDVEWSIATEIDGLGEGLTKPSYVGSSVYFYLNKDYEIDTDKWNKLNDKINE